MELKPYQRKVVKDLEQFLQYYTDHNNNVAEAYGAYWEDKLGMPYRVLLNGETEGMRPYKDNLPGAVHIAIKVPTAGGKTFIAVNAIDSINEFFNQGYPKAVVWLVPWSNLLQQTVNNLSNPEHPYRQKLNALFGSKVGFDRVQVAIQANRGKIDQYKMEQLFIKTVNTVLRTIGGSASLSPPSGSGKVIGRQFSRIIKWFNSCD